MSLPGSLKDTLPGLLKSRPQRQIIEKRRSENIVVEATTEQRPPFFITNVENSHVDFTNLPRLAQLTIEDCGKLHLKLCPVIASIDLVKCEDVSLSISQARGTVCIDMSKVIVLQLQSDVEAGFVIYTSCCDSVFVKAELQEDYILPKRDIMKMGRYKTWKDSTGWQTSRCNLYGDVIGESETDST